MNLLRKIFSYSLAVIFLVVATGFNYTRYTCLESGKVQFVLDVKYTGYYAKAGSHCQEKSVCCAIDKKESCDGVESDEECCVDKTNYLKTDEDYTAPERTRLPKIEIHHISAFQSAEFFPKFTLATKEIAHFPPDLYSSRDLILQYGIQLI